MFSGKKNAPKGTGPATRFRGQKVQQVASDVGRELRQARLDLGVDLETAARDLKIREDYLAALEENDHAALPGLAYAAGFVRSYATYVGLDPEALVHRLKGRTETVQPRTEFLRLAPVRQGRISGGLVFILSLVLAGSAYAGWYYHSMDDRRPALSADAVVDEAATPIVVAAAGAAREVPKTAVRDGAVEKKTRVGPAVAGDPGASGPQTKRRQGATGSQDDTARRKAGAAADGGRNSGRSRPELDAGIDPVVAGIGEDRKADEKAATTADQVVTLKALGYVWMRVRDPQSRRVIAERTLKKGDVLRLPKVAGLVLDVGRANLIEIMIGNRSAGLAGATVGPRRNVSLDPGQLKRGG